MVLLDLFSGIGGFSEGFVRAGYNITTHYFSEVDKHCIANYKYNFKDSIYVGSVTSLDGRSIIRPNIITFGSPCQDFSMAGKREGMEGQRSSLIREAIRLITECKPDVFIWENVKGAFSSNDSQDFWEIVQAFANIGGYRLEWQLLNTAWVLPQNRERIYLVGHLGDGGGRNVFPIGCNGVQVDDLSRQQGIANTLTARYYGSQATGSYIIKRKLNEKEVRVVGNLKGDGGHNVNNVLSTQGISTTVRENHCVDTGNVNAIEYNKRIRRWTEVECERLQGFKDHWTEYGDYDGVIKKIAKTQRYKMCGNAVTADIVELIANRLDFRI